MAFMISKTPHRNPVGFTLLELVLILGVLGILAGISSPAIRGIRDWLADRESRLLFMELETACRLYRMEWGDWPEELANEEVELSADPATWRRLLGPYMGEGPQDGMLSDGHGNTDIRLVLDADGDHWIEGSRLIGVPEADRTERLWARVAIYSLDADGNLVAKSW